MCLTAGRQSRDHDHCRVTLQWLFTKKFLIAWNVQKTLFDSRPTVAWPQPLSRDRSATFFKMFPNCLNVQKTLFDSQPTVAWPPTTVAWPFSDFFSKFSQIAWNVQKRCLTVGRRSRDLRPLSRDRSATFFQNFPKSLETSKKRCLTVSRRSRDLRPLSRDRSATFFEKFLIAWNVQKTLFDSRPTVAWPPTTVAWPFSDFFQNFPKLLETSKNRCLTVGRRSRDLNHCRVTVQRLFSKFPRMAWNVYKTLFDSRPMVAWPPTTVAWPFSDSFQNSLKMLETSKKRCLTVGRRSRDLNHCRVTVQRLFIKIFPKSLETSKKCCSTVSRPSRDLRPLSRDRSATFFKFFSNCLKRPKNVVWQSADGRVTSITVAWPFSDFFKIFPNRLKRPKNVVWQSADGRVTSDHCRVTVQRLFSKNF